METWLHNTDGREMIGKTNKSMVTVGKTEEGMTEWAAARKTSSQ